MLCKWYYRLGKGRERETVKKAWKVYEISTRDNTPNQVLSTCQMCLIVSKGITFAYEWTANVS